MKSKKHAPMTAVSNKKGSFGFVRDIVDDKYSIKWLVGDETKQWFSGKDLEFGENIAISLMNCISHPCIKRKTPKYRVIKE